MLLWCNVVCLQNGVSIFLAFWGGLAIWQEAGLGVKYLWNRRNIIREQILTAYFDGTWLMGQINNYFKLEKLLTSKIMHRLLKFYLSHHGHNCVGQEL